MKQTNKKKIVHSKIFDKNKQKQKKNIFTIYLQNNTTLLNMIT